MQRVFLTTARRDPRAARLAVSLVVAGAASLAAACGDAPVGPSSDGATVDAPVTDAMLTDAATADGPSPVDDRPYQLHVPTAYRAGTPTPLVVMLHGYSASAVIQEAYFRLQPIAEAEGFLYARPDGTVDSFGQRFWNATPACCNLGGSTVDDVAYLRAVIDDVAARYTVDPKRVFVVGHSNGGFMAHRLACDLSDRVAAIVSFAGATFADPGRCQPSQPVSVLQLHGTLDAVILYDGGRVTGADEPYPAAVTTTAVWRQKNGCTGTVPGPRVDLAAGVVGSETETLRATGCVAGGAVELLSIRGAGHTPPLSQPDFGATVWGFFAAHPRP